MGVKWRDFLLKFGPPVLQAVLIAVIVAVLVQLGYPIGPIYPVEPAEDPGISVAGISHFSSVYSNGDVETVDDVIVGDDCTVAGLATVGETLDVTGASDFTGEMTLVNVTASGTLDVAGVSTLAGPVDATGALTVTGVTTLASNVTAGGYFGLGEQTFISVTAGLSITPTSSYIGLRSAEAVTTGTTTAITDGDFVGQVLILVNENASDAITIDDGGNTQLSGDAVLGEGDTLMVIWDGADWLEVAQANNT